MGDLALTWNPDAGNADLTVDATADDLTTDEGLQTAVLLSLFTDRRAEDDDPLPADNGDRRGWWADELSDTAGDLIGSKLWLLDRSKRTENVAQRAESYIREALAWMLEDQILTKLDVTADVSNPSHILLTITLTRPAQGDVSFQFAHVWDGELAKIS